MKTSKIMYWTTTGLFSAMMLFSGYSYLTNEEMKSAFVHLGFPSYFRIELGIAKIIGVVLILLPIMPKRIKELAYAGFALTFISAIIAHRSSGDPVSVAVAPLISLVILAASYFYSNKVNHQAILNNKERQHEKRN